MKAKPNIPSLFPHKSSSPDPFCFKISLLTEASSLVEKTVFPFLFLGDCNSLPHTVEVKWFGDGEGEIIPWGAIQVISQAQRLECFV